MLNKHTPTPLSRGDKIIKKEMRENRWQQ